MKEQKQIRITPQLFEATVAAASEVLYFDFPADSVLSRFFREERMLGSADRGFIAETVYALLRRKRMLEGLVGNQASPRQLVIATLTRLQGVSLRQLADAIGEQHNHLFSALNEDTQAPRSLAEQADFPDWLAEMLSRNLSSGEILSMARSLNSPAPLDLRVNLMKASRDDVLAQLQAGGIKARAGELSPAAIRLEGKPALQRHPLFLSGVVEVQDEGSQLLCNLVAPRRGEMVADFCAGAGGKTLGLGALMRSTGRLYAFDVSEKRLARMKPRLARSGLSNVHPVCLASESDTRVKRLAGKLDRVLVDAPCSGLGTLRRNPDLKWRQSPEGVEELVCKQQSILNAAARLVKPGGRLVYATCSILRQENEEIVEAFLEAHPQFRLVSAAEVLKSQKIPVDTGDYLRLSPVQHSTDGFFAAVLERARVVTVAVSAGVAVDVADEAPAEAAIEVATDVAPEAATDEVVATEGKS